MSRPALRAALMWVTALLLLWVLFRRTDWGAVARSVAGVDVRWLVASQVVSWGSYFVRAQRWGYVVRAAGPMAFRSLFSATQIGFLVNFAVPGRVGELARAFVLSRLEGLPLSRSMAMVAFDRLLDVFALLLVVLGALALYPRGRSVSLPAGTIGNEGVLSFSGAGLGAAALALAVAFGLALLVFLALHRHQSAVVRAANALLRPLSRALAARAGTVLAGFAGGLRLFHSRADLAVAALLSLVVWGSGLLSLAAVLRAFDLPFPWFAPLVILAGVALAISVPITPGVVGQYHVSYVLCLLLAVPDADVNTAKAAAIVTHALSLLPVALLGVYSLHREKLALTDLLAQSLKRGDAPPGS